MDLHQLWVGEKRTKIATSIHSSFFAFFKCGVDQNPRVQSGTSERNSSNPRAFLGEALSELGRPVKWPSSKEDSRSTLQRIIYANERKGEKEKKKRETIPLLIFIFFSFSVLSVLVNLFFVNLLKWTPLNVKYARCLQETEPHSSNSAEERAPLWEENRPLREEFVEVRQFFQNRAAAPRDAEQLFE